MGAQVDSDVTVTGISFNENPEEEITAMYYFIRLGARIINTAF